MNLETIKTGLENNELGFENIIVKINEEDDNELVVIGELNGNETGCGLCIHNLNQMYNGFKMSTRYNNETLEDMIIFEVLHYFENEKIELEKNEK